MRTNGRGFESVLPRLNPLVKQDRILGRDSGSNKVQDVGPGGGGWWPSARQHPRSAASNKIRSPSRPSVVLPFPCSPRCTGFLLPHIFTRPRTQLPGRLPPRRGPQFLTLQPALRLGCTIFSFLFSAKAVPRAIRPAPHSPTRETAWNAFDGSGPFLPPVWGVDV